MHVPDPPSQGNYILASKDGKAGWLPAEVKGLPPNMSSDLGKDWQLVFVQAEPAK